MKKLNLNNQEKIIGGGWDDFIDGVCEIGGIGTIGGLGYAAALKVGLKVLVRANPVSSGIMLAIDVGCTIRGLYSHM